MTNQTRKIIKALRKAQKSIYDRRRHLLLSQEGNYSCGLIDGLREAYYILRRHIKKLKK